MSIHLDEDFFCVAFEVIVLFNDSEFKRDAFELRHFENTFPVVLRFRVRQLSL